MHVLSEQLHLNQVKISNNSVRSIKGMKNARFAPNKRVNLHTVDEMARLMANHIASMLENKHIITSEELNNDESKQISDTST